jgi:putative redox protein
MEYTSATPTNQMYAMNQPADTPETATMTVQLVRQDDAFHFAATGAAGVRLDIDGSTDIGGHNAGARPMEMLLMGLAGCTAIDVILILQKQKQIVTDFQIQVDGQRDKHALPSPFHAIHITYRLGGALDAGRVQRAIDLSMDKYCSATAQLRPSAQITYSFELSA